MSSVSNTQNNSQQASSNLTISLEEMIHEINKARSIEPKSVEYRDDIVSLVVPILQRSALRDYFRGGEIMVAYSDSKNWYPAPLQVFYQGNETRRIYRTDIPREGQAPSQMVCKDRLERKYLLISVNGGHVPVRHGTDPILGNWLAQDSRIRIVYDANYYRHPACDRIDYSSHGFHLLNGKVWWPLANGQFNIPSFKRVRDPYYENYTQLFIPEQREGENNSRGVIEGCAALAGTVAATYLLPGMGQAIASGTTTSLGTNIAGPFIGGLTAFNVAQQALGSNSMNEASANARAQDRRRQEIQLQRATLETLNQQDSIDFSEELIKAMNLNTPLASIQQMVRDNPEVHLLAEHRGKVAKEAANLGKVDELEWILNSGSVSPADLSIALMSLVERESDRGVRLLLQKNIHISKIGEAAILATKLGLSGILRTLLARQISPEDRGQAVCEAVGRGSETDLDLLLGAPITSEKRGLAAIAACQQPIAFLRKILNSGSISTQHRGEAVVASIGLGCIQHMRLLLANSASISMEHRGQAAISAAKLGLNDILLELSTNGQISLIHKQECMRSLVRDNPNEATSSNT